jgi:hypothetical protein
MTPPEIKAAVRQAIDAQRDDIVGVAQQIFAAPELGFKEVRTARLVVDRFAAMGLPCEEGLALTGVKAILPGAREVLDQYTPRFTRDSYLSFLRGLSNTQLFEPED